jgi:hypothetical protein
MQRGLLPQLAARGMLCIEGNSAAVETADAEGGKMNEEHEPTEFPERNVDSTLGTVSPEAVASDELREEPPAPTPPALETSPVVPPQRRRHNVWKGIAIALVVVVVAALATTAAFYFKYKAEALAITSSIKQRDDKLTERATNALAVTSNLKFASVVAEVDAVISERSALISEIEQQTVPLFQQTLDATKSTLIAENDQLGKERVARLRQELAPLVQQDNVALGDVFLIDSDTSTLSWKEAFDTVDKNVADRTTLITTVKLLPPLEYASTLSGYVALLEAENDFCRTYGRYLRALFNLSVDIDVYNSSYYPDYSSLVHDRVDIADALKEFNGKYDALLKRDKAFWPTAKAIFPDRDLQKALTDFYKSVNGTASGSKT